MFLVCSPVCGEILSEDRLRASCIFASEPCPFCQNVFEILPWPIPLVLVPVIVLGNLWKFGDADGDEAQDTTFQAGS